jgi:5-methylcytosine-specific restriction endonuclease McrA
MPRSILTCEIISREGAIELGRPHYRTGIPCVNGHDGPRSVRTRQCLACTRMNVGKIRDADPIVIARKARQPKPVVPADRIITRADAKRRGLLRYFTGVPCKNGHLSERMTRGKVCLACHRERATVRRAETPERVAAIKARSYARHADTVKSKVKAYQKENRDAVRKRKRAHYLANWAEIRAKFSEWAKANRHILRVHERRYKALLKGAEGTHTAADVARLMEEQGALCASPACRKSLVEGYQVDHIVPLSRGGTNWATNIQLLCSTCNQSKSNKHVADWLAEQGVPT